MVARELATILVFLPAGILSVSQNKENSDKDQDGITFYLPSLHRLNLDSVT